MQEKYDYYKKFMIYYAKLLINNTKKKFEFDEVLGKEINDYVLNFDEQNAIIKIYNYIDFCEECVSLNPNLIKYVFCDVFDTYETGYECKFASLYYDICKKACMKDISLLRYIRNNKNYYNFAHHEFFEMMIEKNSIASDYITNIVIINFYNNSNAKTIINTVTKVHYYKNGYQKLSLNKYNIRQLSHLYKNKHILFF